MFLGLLDPDPDPDPLVRGMDPDPDPALDPSNINDNNNNNSLFLLRPNISKHQCNKLCSVDRFGKKPY